MKIELTDSLFRAAIPILKRIESHGNEAYFVGGCVRDTLLDQKIHDIDIASSARPEEIEAIFPTTIDVGKEHGTIIVVEKQVPYEITTFRTEGNYSDFRHPDSVDFVRDLKEDTLRRDFTINALAIDSTGQLFDYHQGAVDLNNQLIRAVGNPNERFKEDALRMVRAIRFASQLGFKIEAATFQAIQTLSPLLVNIATERIRIELTKFFQGKYFENTWHLLSDSLIADALPLFQQLDVKQAMQSIKEHLPSHYRLDERMGWYLLCRGLKLTQKQMRVFLRKWTHSNQFIQDVSDLYEIEPLILDKRLDSWQVYTYPIELMRQMEDYLCQVDETIELIADTIYSRLPIYQKQDIVVNGSQMMQWLGLDKGNARLGKVIQAVEKEIVMGQLANEVDAIHQFVLANY